MKARFLLIAGGICTFGIFLLHVYIAIYGGELYRYFGAGDEFAKLSANGSLLPGIVTAAISIVFLITSLYAFSAVGLLRKLPLTRFALSGIGIVFTVRGLAVLPEYLVLHTFAHRGIIFSLSSLIVGLLYLSGTIINRKILK